MRNRLQVCVCERGGCATDYRYVCVRGGMRNRLQVCVCERGGCATDYRYVCV